MAFPHDQDGAGDIKSLKRAAWAGLYSNSKYMALVGGSAYPLATTNRPYKLSTYQFRRRHCHRYHCNCDQTS